MDLSDLPFELDTIVNAREPLLRVGMDADKRPNRAQAAARVLAPPERVWQVVSDVERYAGRVPMMDKVTLRDEMATVGLKFRIAVFSAKFSFKARARSEAGRMLELSHVEGEPRDLVLRFDVLPVEDPAQSVLVAGIGFDISSLGWLVKFFLKHHPEIQYGVFPGSALTLVDTLRREAELAFVPGSA
ncbi:MAG: SRPBCC family protein [Myxococcales bacterium]|nr:SRPBCC family protein [Myxococcales bacterium]MCB9582294.1 hypothetical protein [Polyangiaceae bacterium]